MKSGAATESGDETMCALKLHDAACTVDGGCASVSV